jgi:cell division protein FtsB
VAGQVEREAVTKLPRLSLVQVVIILAAALVGYFVFSAASDALLSYRLNEEEQQLRREIRDLQRDQARLQEIRDYLQTTEYIEGVARRVLGLVRPGETLVVVTSDATPTPQASEEDAGTSPGTWWERLYGE